MIKPIRVALVNTSIVPYAIPSGRCLSKDSRIETKHFYVTKLERGRKWGKNYVPFSHEIVKSFNLRIRNKTFYIPFTLPFRLREFKPNIIAVEELGTLCIFTYAYALLARIPVIIGWESHFHTERNRNKGIRKFLRRVIILCAAGFLAYTPGAKRYLKDIGAKGPFFLIPVSVDSKIFVPPRTPRKKYTLLYVGQLIPRKGVHLLLKIFLEVLHNEKSAKLWIAGDGPLKEELKEILPEHAKNSIKWYGFLNQAEVVALYKRASVFVFPSLNDAGGMALVEAVNSGLPIVTSPFAGNSEILVENGKNGYIVDPRDKKLFANAILSVLRNENKGKMYETSLKIAKQHTPERTAEYFIQAVMNTLSAKEKKLSKIKKAF